jgi:hypothetical protein
MEILIALKNFQLHFYITPRFRLTIIILALLTAVLLLPLTIVQKYIQQFSLPINIVIGVLLLFQLIYLWIIGINLLKRFRETLFSSETLEVKNFLRKVHLLVFCFHEISGKFGSVDRVLRSSSSPYLPYSSHLFRFFANSLSPSSYRDTNPGIYCDSHDVDYLGKAATSQNVP